MRNGLFSASSALFYMEEFEFLVFKSLFGGAIFILSGFSILP